MAADSRGQGGQLPTLRKKKVGKTMFLPTYLREEAPWHRIPQQMNSVQQIIFSGGVAHRGRGGILPPLLRTRGGTDTICSIISVYNIGLVPDDNEMSCTSADRERHFSGTGGPHVDKGALW